MGNHYEIACMTCKTDHDLGKLQSSGFSNDHFALYAFLHQHLDSSCDLLICQEGYDSIWYDLKYSLTNNLDSDNYNKIHNELLKYYSEIPENDGIRIYNHLGHFIEISKKQLEDLSDVADFFSNTLFYLKNQRLQIEDINLSPRANTRLAQLDRYQERFELGCIQCKTFIDVGSTAAWKCNGFEDYDLLFSFLSEHQKCSSTIYLSTLFSQNQPWRNDDITQLDEPHCNPEWMWDTRSLNPKTICCYKSITPQIPNLLPNVLTLKSNPQDTISILKDQTDHLDAISDWLYDHREKYIEVLS